ncbi:hypothetical protein KC359_g199 [Hortaea werneckii]|nr:hypothetical protein KC359_g199 [Hortaea werneckii]
MLNDIVLTTVTLIIGGPTPRQNARMPSALYASFTSRGKATKVDSTLLVDAAISMAFVPLLGFDGCESASFFFSWSSWALPPGDVGVCKLESLLFSGVSWILLSWDVGSCESASFFLSWSPDMLLAFVDCRSELPSLSLSFCPILSADRGARASGEALHEARDSRCAETSAAASVLQHRTPPRLQRTKGVQRRDYPERDYPAPEWPKKVYGLNELQNSKASHCCRRSITTPVVRYKEVLLYRSESIATPGVQYISVERPIADEGYEYIAILLVGRCLQRNRTVPALWRIVAPQCGVGDSMGK